MFLKGIDVSTFQGYPDWKKVKEDGIEFAIIKATQGRAESSNSYLFTDSKFKYNIINAYNQGIKCGVYHYLTAKTVAESIKEANYFLSVIKPYKKYITLYAAIDVESKHLAGISKSNLTNIVIKFYEKLRESGYTPIIYTNPNWMINRLNDISNYNLWLALWRDINNAPKSYDNMKIWQYGASYVDGINGGVDSNLGYFNSAQKEEVKDTVTNNSNRELIEVGSKVRVENPIIYGTTKKFKTYFSYYNVISIKGDRVVIGKGRIVTAAININNIELV